MLEFLLCVASVWYGLYETSKGGIFLVMGQRCQVGSRTRNHENLCAVTAVCYSASKSFMGL